jgi:adenylate cyclase class 2
MKRVEIEVKLASVDLDRFRRAGFELKLREPRRFEDNWLLDSDDGALLRRGAALRVRSVAGKGLLTYKGAPSQQTSSPLKIREEIEVSTDDPYRMMELLERIGFRRSFHYQKYRTSYATMVDGCELEIALDETPIGNFIEVEGDEHSVMEVITKAGFAPEELILETYPEMQAVRCRARGVPLEDLIFK